MGRPKTFDEDAVLDRAIELFWTTGYHAVSVRDLEEGTGVLKGSLYAAFGDKRALFLATLRRYADNSAREIRELLTHGKDARAGLEHYLRVRGKDCTGPSRGRGCLLANTAAEVAPHDPEVRAVVGQSFEKLAAALAPALRESQEQGLISRRHDARELAAHLVVLVQGMSVVGKTEPDSALIRSSLRFALSLLEPDTPEKSR
ncbi:transcriptional regulator, TetR family [Myxococcus fulvus]|uniref:TetR family transcriptional regulator n=1 Tax=Myxococcus fulvus TaxID=33 RepID=A0A511TID6_MYXFU|nr:TetR/AcrR family transcriptional regulator [Myxococcus fulvus]GEN13363.1 TetR family transcriptional regulator [Myxococcus fulvus]SEU41808.1 transcriptional regulator, TetR family [Myxococcus fulvus]